MGRRKMLTGAIAVGLALAGIFGSTATQALGPDPALTDGTKAVVAGNNAFAFDLYHRLAAFPVRLPPLRERPEDILPLAEVLLADVCRDLKRPSLALSPAAREALVAAPWPGNVRQLRNALERAAILCEGPVLGDLGLPAAAAPSSAPPLALDSLEKGAIVRALAATQGNRRKAAQALGIGLRTLYDKLKRYGIG